MRRAVAFVTLLGFLLAGCGKRDDGPVSVAVIGTPAAFAELSGTRRPGVRLSPAAQLLEAATAEGLVGFDDEGRVIPALADRWIVTEDGQSYIFRLRNGEWPDGSAITGESAATALRRTIATLRGRPLGRDLAAIDEIRAMAGRVIEIRLEQPVPDLLDLLAQPELGLRHKGRGAGPMALDRQGALATLVPIKPEARGLPAEENWDERVRGLRVRIEPAAAAVARFNDGFADVVLGGGADTLPLIQAQGLGLSRGNLRLDPVIGLFGLLAANRTGLLADADTREALAMAIDRDALLGEFAIGGWVPTTRIVSPEAADAPTAIGERWDGVDLVTRQSTAAARVARWKAGSGAVPRLRIALPKTPGGDIIFARLRDDFGAIGVETARVGETAPADLRLFDVVARYGRAAWFLNQLSCAAGRAVCSAEGDTAAREALTAPDEATRAELRARAETEITAANGFIPFARPLRWSLVRGDISGFATNPWGLHPLLPLALDPR